MRTRGRYRYGRRRLGACFESLEPRLLLSGATWAPESGANSNPAPAAQAPQVLTVAYAVADPIVESISPDASAPPGAALTPTQICQAYGFDQVMFGSIQG